MGIDLRSMSVDELKEFERGVLVELERRKGQHRKDTLKQVEELVRDRGFASVWDLLGVKNKKTAAKPVLPPKFRNPANPAETWSGRGRRPKWFLEALENGKTEDDLLI